MSRGNFLQRKEHAFLTIFLAQLLIFIDFTVAQEPQPGKDNSAVTEAIKLLSSKNGSERIAGANRLQKLGEQAKPALEPLCYLLRDKDKDVQIAAIDAISEIEPNLASLAKDYIINQKLPDVIKAERNKVDLSPLAPLIVDESISSIKKIKAINTTNASGIAIRLDYLVSLAPNNPNVSKLALSGINSPHEAIARSAIGASTQIIDRKDSVPLLIKAVKKPINMLVWKEATIAIVKLSDNTNMAEIIECYNLYKLNPNIEIRKIAE